MSLQGAHAQDSQGKDSPGPSTSMPQSSIAAAVAAVFANLTESDAEELYSSSASWASLLSEDLDKLQPTQSSPGPPQPADLPLSTGDCAIVHALWDL